VLANLLAQFFDPFFGMSLHKGFGGLAYKSVSEIAGRVNGVL
jgi:hypothetical protein